MDQTTIKGYADPEGSDTFGGIRIRSGTETHVSDPDSKPDLYPFGSGFETNFRPDPDQKFLFGIRNTNYKDTKP
jgi:hypothetical protein